MHVMRAQRQALPSKTLMQLAGWDLTKAQVSLACHCRLFPIGELLLWALLPGKATDPAALMRTNTKYSLFVT